MKDLKKNESASKKLLVVWTSGDREVALKMVFMYVFNAKKNGWWNDITLLIWGPSSKLTTEDEEIQNYLKKMMDVGVEVTACKACAELYGNVPDLEKTGVTVKYTGTYLTQYIKDQKVITF